MEYIYVCSFSAVLLSKICFSRTRRQFFFMFSTHHACVYSEPIVGGVVRYFPHYSPRASFRAKTRYLHRKDSRATTAGCLSRTFLILCCLVFALMFRAEESSFDFVWSSSICGSSSVQISPVLGPEHSVFCQTPQAFANLKENLGTAACALMETTRQASDRLRVGRGWLALSDLWLSFFKTLGSCTRVCWYTHAFRVWIEQLFRKGGWLWIVPASTMPVDEFCCGFVCTRG